MQNITPFLWFDGRAEEAMNFYTSLFKNSRIQSLSPIGENAKMGSFEIDGLSVMALDGGPMYQFSPAISMFVSCEDQAEIDRLWDALAEGGQTMQCGWLTDRFGVTWQIIPKILGELMSDPDREKAGRVMQAMFGMVKMDIDGLKRAHAGSD